jgi:hypothetical protein
VGEVLVLCLPNALAVEGFIGLFVYVIFVPLLFAALLLFGKRVGKHTASRWFGFLFEGYRDGVSYYFELAYMLRRFVLAAVLALVPARSLLQPHLVSLTLGLAVLVQVIMAPYERAVENSIEIASLLVLLVTYNVSTALDSFGWNSAESNWANENLTSNFILVVNVLMVLAFLLALGWPYVAAFGRVLRRVLRARSAPTVDEEVTVLRVENSRLRDENKLLRHRSSMSR